MTTLSPPIAFCYQSLLTQNVDPGSAFYMCRHFSNGQERDGVFSCMNHWEGREVSMARKVAIREASRMYGFNPPNMDDIVAQARQISMVLANDPNGVYSSKPCGEQWNWYALACFFNWYFWLNPEAQAQVRSDIEAGSKKWAVWAMHFQTLCPNEVRNDPVYAHWYNDLFSYGATTETTDSSDAIDPSWDRKGLASTIPLGPVPQPWPLLRAQAGAPSIPGLPVPPCEPFPSCVAQMAMDAGLPMPCVPFPECVYTAAKAATLLDPTLEMAVTPEGTGTYVAENPPKTTSSSPKWLVPALLVALGVGVVGAAVMVSSKGVYEG